MSAVQRLLRHIGNVELEVEASVATYEPKFSKAEANAWLEAQSARLGLTAGEILLAVQRGWTLATIETTPPEQASRIRRRVQVSDVPSVLVMTFFPFCSCKSLGTAI